MSAKNIGACDQRTLDDMLHIVWLCIGGDICLYADASFERRLKNVHLVQKEDDVGACEQGARADFFP